MSILLDGRPIRVPVSGVARYCLSLANALLRLQDSGNLEELPLPDVLVQSGGGINKTIAALDDRLTKIELTPFGKTRKTQNLVMEFLPALTAATSLSKYDIIHETYFANLAYSPRHHKVATIHDVFPIEYPHLFNMNNRLLAKRNFFRQVKLSDTIIAVSQYTKQRIIELSGCPEDRIAVIGCGVNPADAEKANDATWPIAGKLGKNDNYCLYVGNLEPRKNVDALIDAWAMLAPRHRDVKLVVAGKFNYRAEATISRGEDRLGHRFVYLGPVDEPDKWGALTAARALILPSLYEGYGIPIIEAYVAGTLALFSRTSAMTELALDARQMFDPLDIGSIAETIDAALDSSAWQADVRKRAEQWVADQSWDRIAYDVASVYRRVLGR